MSAGMFMSATIIRPPRALSSTKTIGGPVPELLSANMKAVAIGMATAGTNGKSEDSNINTKPPASPAASFDLLGAIFIGTWKKPPFYRTFGTVDHGEALPNIRDF
jgi:hypothetical protein